MQRWGPGARVLKTSLAAGLSWALATHVSQNRYPYFAPLAVILTLQATIADTLARGLYRVAGIVGGVSVSLLVGYWFPTGAVTIALTIFLGMALSTALRLNSLITSQVAVTALLVLVSKDSRHYAVDRILETALGAVVAVVVNAVLVPPNEIPGAERQVLTVTDLLATALRNLSRGEQDSGLTEQVRQRPHRALLNVQSTQRNLAFTPFLRRRRARLNQLALALAELEKMAVQVRGVTRGLEDLRAHGVHDTGLQAALEDAADCVAAFGRSVVSPSEGTQRTLKEAVSRALANEPLHLARLTEGLPPAVLRDLGAVYADLSRILTEVQSRKP